MIKNFSVLSNTESGCFCVECPLSPTISHPIHTHTRKHTQLTVFRWARVGFSHASFPTAHSVQYTAWQQDTHTMPGFVCTQRATHWTRMTETHWSMDEIHAPSYTHKYTHTDTNTHTAFRAFFLRGRGLQSQPFVLWDPQWEHTQLDRVTIWLTSFLTNLLTNSFKKKKLNHQV